MDRFQAFLNQLSLIVQVPLYADRKRAVRLTIDQSLHMQIEDEEQNNRILIASFLHEIPAGKYRENLLKEGLKANTLYPRIGTFAYCERNNQFCLFDYLSYINLTGEKAADRLACFIEKALNWRQAIAKGMLPTANEPETKIDHSVFGER